MKSLTQPAPQETTFPPQPAAQPARWTSVLPGIARGIRRGWEGAAWGSAIAGVAGALLAVAYLATSVYSPFGRLADIVGLALGNLLAIGLLGAIMAAAVRLARAGLGWVGRALRWSAGRRVFQFLSGLLGWVPLPLVFGLGGILGAMQLKPLFPETILVFFSLQSVPLGLVMVEGALGALAGAALAFRPRGTLGIFARGISLLPLLAANLGLIAWAAWPGFDDYLVRQPAPSTPSPALTMANPGQAGPFAVRACTYGSGSDLRRPEYAGQACWTSPSVNADDALFDYKPFAQAYYEWFWGFDYDRLPLNGRVWAPGGLPSGASSGDAGPFPLVIIVHGNHPMGDFSDAGYAYLGEHLASQGFIAVSIDENFLNGFFLEDKQKAEMPVRAWLMLKHIEQWRIWNEDPSHPFYHKVDLNQVAVMGHSRGGETAALAAAFNPLDSSPAMGLPPSDFHFNIRAVVEIAPSEGSFRVSGDHPVLEHTSYLLIQGAHDADAYMLNGIRQYNRVKIEPGAPEFKAVIYPYRANHGQFNSGWGHADQNPSWVLNTRPLVSAREQEQEARVFITAFLKSALQGQAGYREVLRRPWQAAAWLPDDIVLSRYQDGGFTLLHAFDTGQLESGALPEVRAQAAGFESASIEQLMTRETSISQNNSALRLAWSQSASAAPGKQADNDFQVRLPAELARGAHAVSFLLAPADESQPPAGVTVVVEDSAGRMARLALGEIAPLPVLLPAQLVKDASVAKALNVQRSFEKPAERFLQTCILPLDRFHPDPGFDRASLRAIHFHFDTSPSGAVLLDEVALVK